MKIKLVFNDWLKQLPSHEIQHCYNTNDGFNLTKGDFHSGTTFNAEIQLDEEQEQELTEALTKTKAGVRFIPVFWVFSEKE